MTTHEWTAAPARARPGSVWAWTLLQFLLATAVLTLIVVLTFILAIGLVQRDYRGRIYPGVRVWQVDVGGMTQAQAMQAIAAVLPPQTARITLRDGERTWTATPEELGLRLDASATVAAAYAVGREGGLLSNLIAQAQTWYGGKEVSPVAILDPRRAQAVLARIQADVDQPVRDADIIISPEGGVQATPSQVGRALDVPATLNRILDALIHLRGGEIPLVIHETSPAIADTSATAAQSQRMLGRPLELYVDDQAGEEQPGPWVLSPQALISMAVVRRVESPDGPRLEVGLDAAKLRAWVEPITATVQIEPQDARLRFDENTGQLTVLQPSREGRSLDVEATVARILEHAASDDRRVPLAFRRIPPQVPDNKSAAELGITELVAEGTTYFKGSPKERITNIKVAAARFDGVVIPPGGVFSFNAYLGDVSLDTGFAEALIIYNGRTIQGVGGGVCQVSTTAFRAAFFGGYPILERYPHAYRVSWYERGFGPGLDATVYAPLVDFKFKNDRPYYLLITTLVDEKAGTLTYKFYSTSDGRQIKVEPPVITNVVPHGPDIYEEDPTLPQGTVKQVDWAVDGADVTVKRVVTRNGEVLYQDTVFTRYEPWQAVFKVGTGLPASPSP
jgi:vancomycin resistance protein YoaR